MFDEKYVHSKYVSMFMYVSMCKYLRTYVFMPVRVMLKSYESILFSVMDEVRVFHFSSQRAASSERHIAFIVEGVLLIVVW